MDTGFVNKVAESGIITLNLEDHYPKAEPAVFDMKDYLFMELILKEKDFREALKNLDVTPYTGKVVALTCSADAVIPMWAYMLVASLLQPVAKELFLGSAEAYLSMLPFIWRNRFGLSYIFSSIFTVIIRPAVNLGNFSGPVTMSGTYWRCPLQCC